MSTCATASRESAEPMAGTAATARTWLLIEQTGPWGAQALTSSHLDSRVGRTLESAAEGTGVRVALIRRPGRHADCHASLHRRVYVAHTAPGRSWIRTTTLTDPAALLELDFAALGAGEAGTLDGPTDTPTDMSADIPGGGASQALETRRSGGDESGGDEAAGQMSWRPHGGEPLVFVCTNGRRDRCCALLGRPLAAELAADGADTWEVTHIGGHRFSPTLLLLPYGYAYGRASAHLVKEAVEAVRDGRVSLDHCRGRSTWGRPAQAADLAVRELTREERADALDVVRVEQVERVEAASRGEGTGPSWNVTVAHGDGRTWQVAVEQRSDGAPTPASCGAPLGPPARMAVAGITALAA
ncbi:sucrase ferredoxin [Streptomyces sp. MST-110588]|uniref:sucrase ferredoxin n=1 Tax=Streptomyces sp. MST-110588 TaxID=2833628 RepID=UPI001F5E31D8|nr:sucrase ferredoxin [Streptomyces sp. MST-110588]UNO39562.1 sucrase ferredoxin [Streptomyces sp. MST-110588]